MIDFDTYYAIAADQIESIQATERSDDDYPYYLIVHMKSGKECCVRYKDKKTRDKEKQLLVRCVEDELSRRKEDIANRLFLIDDKLKRMDGRQLRIWRLLKELAQGKADADSLEEEAPQ